VRKYLQELRVTTSPWGTVANPKNPGRATRNSAAKDAAIRAVDGALAANPGAPVDGLWLAVIAVDAYEKALRGCPADAVVRKP